MGYECLAHLVEREYISSVLKTTSPDAHRGQSMAPNLVRTRSTSHRFDPRFVHVEPEIQACAGPTGGPGRFSRSKAA